MAYSFHEPPEFDDEGRTLRLDGNVKGYLTEDLNDGATVFIWSQDPFYAFDGFSMSKRLVNVVTQKAERVYVLSTNEDGMFEYSTDIFESDAARTIPPDHDVFNVVRPEKQVVIPIEAGTRFDLPKDIDWMSEHTTA